MKFKVSWWIHGAGAICRGHDVVDGSEDFDEDDADKLINNDLSRNVSDPSSLTARKYDFPSPFEPNLPNFNKKHSNLMMASRDVSNWGVLRVMPLEEMKKDPLRCEFCGRELKENVPLSDPDHIFNKPTSEGHKKACRKCFNKASVRCGLCDVQLIGSFADHVKSELHQSNLPKVKPVKMPEVPVRQVSEAERTLNRSKVAQAENLGYYSVSNGRSYYRLKCECGEISDVFAWRGCKRCPNCEKLLHLSLSFVKESK